MSSAASILLVDDDGDLREALAEKMILDWDYLPIPAMLDTAPPAKKSKAKRQK